MEKINKKEGKKQEILCEIPGGGTCMPCLRTILIVEDNAVNRSILNKILSTEYRILEAKNGEEGLEILLKSKEIISAIILDLVMPVMDGYTFLKHMNENIDY